MPSKGPIEHKYSLNTQGYGSHQALADLVRAESRVLDVGCAQGYLMDLLRDSMGCDCVGVEPEAGPAAATAERHPVHSVVFTSEARDLLTRDGLFDHVIFADVLEHMVDPAAAMVAGMELLRPGGSLLISVPNIVYLRARLRVLFGRFDYEEAGLFDETHLRFFTLSSFDRLVKDHGWTIRTRCYIGPLSHRFGRRGAALARLWPGVLTTQYVISVVQE